MEPLSAGSTPRDKSIASAVHGFFFAADAPEDRKLSPGTKYLLIFALFAVTRLAAWISHGCGDFIPLYGNTDPAGYIAEANYIAQHGRLSVEDDQHFRQFAGLPLMMVAVNPLIGNMAVTGYLVVLVTTLGSLALMQHLFGKLRLTLIFCVFLPYWVIATTTIYSEAPAVLCFLIGIWVLRDFKDRPLLLALGVMIAGYSVVIRPPMIFLTAPVVALLAWRLPGGSFPRAILVGILVMLPLAAYLTWNWVTIHQLVPQSRLQYEDMMNFRDKHADKSHYTVQEFNVPFRGVVEGLTDPTETIWKKLSAVGSYAAAMVAIVLLVRMALVDADAQRRALGLAFGVALLIYLLFHSTLWPLGSYKYVDRYFAGASVAIDWALFNDRPLRWPWIAAMAVGGVIFASHMGGYHPFGSD